MLGKGEWGVRSEGPWMFEQSSTLQMVLVVCNNGEVEGGWCSCEVREGFGVGLWNAIRS